MIARMTLSQLAAESAARLADLRAKHGPDADAEAFVSLPGDELEVHGVELFLGLAKPRKWYFEIKTQPDNE